MYLLHMTEGVDKYRLYMTGVFKLKWCHKLSKGHRLLLRMHEVRRLKWCHKLSKGHR